MKHTRPTPPNVPRSRSRYTRRRRRYVVRMVRMIAWGDSITCDAGPWDFHLFPCSDSSPPSTFAEVLDALRRAYSESVDTTAPQSIGIEATFPEHAP